MQRFCSSLSDFKNAGWEIELWCNDCDPEVAQKVDRVVTVPKFPYLFEVLFLPWHWFVWSRFVFEKKLRKSSKIYHATRTHCFGADVVSHNYSELVWLKVFFGLKYRQLRDWLRVPVSVISASLEFVDLHFFHSVFLTTNSDGLRENLLKRTSCKPSQIVFVRNQISPDRFSPQVRTELREKARASFHFKNDDLVYSFASQGHLTRKGWYEALHAISKVREDWLATGEKVNVTFLTIGIRKKTEDRLKGYLEKNVLGWESWVKFVDASNPIEFNLSASDVFLYPSHFDSCANVASEACALGLPCVLGNYYGATLLAENSSVFLIEANTVSNLQEALKKIGTTPSTVTLEQVEFSKAVQSPQEWAGEMIEIYDSVLATREHSR